jgi:hypothetical protein
MIPFNVALPDSLFGKDLQNDRKGRQRYAMAKFSYRGGESVPDLGKHLFFFKSTLQRLMADLLSEAS